MDEILQQYEVRKSNKEKTAFIEYTKNSEIYNHWLPLFTTFLGTGCRVGEVIGLRWEDCDFDNNIININHNLIYRQQDDGKCEFHITTPKTSSGTRIIPMLDEVKKDYTKYKEKISCHVSNSILYNS